MFELHFLHAGMLAAAAAGVIPAVIHLLVRHRPIDSDFPAVRFIKSSVKSSSFKFRLKNLLLLAVRCGLVVLFAFILARPIVKSEHFAAADRAVVRAVIVLDDSYSMAYRDDGEPRLERAKAMALELAEGFEVGSEVAVLTTSSPVGSLSYDLDAVRRQIRDVALRPCAATVWPALARARAMLDDPSDKGREVYLFTDLTAEAFAGATQIAEQFRGEVGLCIVDVGQGASDNFAVSDLRLSRRDVPLGSTVRVAASAMATGQGGERVVQLWVDDEKVGQRVVAFPPKGAAECEFEFRVTEPGTRRGEVVIAGEDPLELDNRRRFTVAAARALRVLCVNGEPAADAQDELFYLVRALKPGGAVAGPTVDVLTSRATEVEPRLAEDWDVAVLCNVSSLPASAWQGLAERVAMGRGLIVFSGDNVSAAVYNSGAPAALMPVKVAEAVTPPEPVHFTVRASAHPLAIAFADGRNGDVGAPAFTRYLRADHSAAQSAAAVPIGLGAKAVGVATKSYQSGRVAWVAVAADAEWGDLPKCACFVPLVHELVHYVGSRQMQTLDVGVGAAATLKLRADQLNARVRVHAPHLKRPRPVSVDQQTATAHFTDTAQPGHYEWEVLGSEGREAVGFAANADAAESRLRRLSRADAAKAFAHTRPLIARDAAELRLAVRKTRVGKETYPALLLVLLALLVFEGYLSNRYYGREPAPAES